MMLARVSLDGVRSVQYSVCEGPDIVFLLRLRLALVGDIDELSVSCQIVLRLCSV